MSLHSSEKPTLPWKAATTNCGKQSDSSGCRRRQRNLKGISINVEAKRLKGDLEQYRTPPLVIGTIESLASDERVIVRSTTGPQFLSKVSETVNPKEIIPGRQCALHPQSYHSRGGPAEQIRHRDLRYGGRIRRRTSATPISAGWNSRRPSYAKQWSCRS